jgi:hypothetical protein
VQDSRPAQAEKTSVQQADVPSIEPVVVVPLDLVSSFASRERKDGQPLTRYRGTHEG